MEQKGKMEMEDGMQERVSETEYKNSSNYGQHLLHHI